jgi:poly-gamma-glutamate synthesis protein (capsule biosynthesis protein)
LWLAGGGFAIAAAVAPLLQPGSSSAHRQDAVSAPVGSAEHAGRSITIMATGEILPHPSVVAHARTGSGYDFAPMFADLAPLLQAADLAICHLEVPVAPDGEALSGYPVFGIPAEIGAGIHTGGWDRCSTASNHSNDKGTAGIAATLNALDGAGVDHSGTARTPEEAARVPIVSVQGLDVAHLSYTWGFNGTAPAQPWMANVIEPSAVLADARAAKAAGADVVVVSLHWGDEYDRVGNEQQRALATELLASADVDLLVGTGPHVLQPILASNGKFALLSLGNVVSNQGAEHPDTYDGAVAAVTFTVAADGTVHSAAPVVRPTWYDAAAGRVRLLPVAVADDALASERSLFEASWARTTAVMGPFVIAFAR